MIQLCGMTPEQLTGYMVDKGQSAFRGDQLSKWVWAGADIGQMSNLPAALREQMSREAVANPVQICQERVSKLDGTRKFLFQLMDGNLVEGVLMRYKYGYTLCLSTQVGCRMGCAFCASTLEGCARNLTAGEMAGQVLLANRVLQGEGARVGNLVLMGSGEPFDNYENVVDFLRLITHPQGLNLSVRGISLSTCGLVEKMDRFAGEGIPVTLSLSLHAPNDAIRRRIMPVARAYSMEDTLAALNRYIGRTGRRGVIEYALIRELNCRREHAAELASRLRGMRCHVNLIPLNRVAERGLDAPSRKQVEEFMEELERRHISVTRRREMGADIQGACGQLRRRFLAEAGRQAGDEGTEKPE